MANCKNNNNNLVRGWSTEFTNLILKKTSGKIFHITVSVALRNANTSTVSLLLANKFKSDIL